MFELPVIREEFGFCRTTCGCSLCQVPCRHMPGGLAPSDLSRLCPPGQDVFVWAEHHLRALIGKSYPILVPARQANGHCHWLFGGRCAVHEAAPYGCAFFDTHMTDAEVKQRLTSTIRARQADEVANGKYYRIWLHLRKQGLVSQSGDRSALLAEMDKIKCKLPPGSVSRI